MSPHPSPLDPDAIAKSFISYNKSFRVSCLAALAIGIAALGQVPARAQIFAGTSIPENPAVGTSSAATPAPPATILRPLPGIVSDLKIVGENGTLTWPVFVTTAQSKASITLRLGVLSAVSILPDDSSLRISVNDHEIGSHAADASQGTATLAFEIPAGALQPGMNAVTVDLRQRHRVDCSVAATYELWTEIDPRRSGLVIPTGLSRIGTLDEIAALMPRADGSMPIHVLLTGKTNPGHLERLIRATQAIALSGGFTQPAVDFLPMSGDTSGVNLALGTRAALAKVPRLAGLIGTDGPLAAVLPTADADRPTILVTGSTDAEVDSALEILAATRSAIGTPAGRRAATNASGKASSGDETFSLRDAGVRSEAFSGRFFHRGFGLAMPANFLSSDYARGTFDLAGAYAAGLGADAQVRLDVNGQSAGLIKLPRAAGDVFRHNQLFVPLHLMRPGYNRIDLYASTPRAEDATCAATSDRRFLLLDSSVMTLPVLARVLRLPDLAAAAAGGLPYTGGQAHLVVPKPDRETVGAALSLTARTAVAAGELVPFSFSTSVVKGQEGSSLVVSPARSLDPALMRQVGLDPAAVETAWRDGPAEPAGSPAASAVDAKLADRWWMADNAAPSACHVPARTPRLDSAVAAAPQPSRIAFPAANPDDDLLEAWTGEAHQRSWGDRVSGLVTGTMAWMDGLGHAVADRAAVLTRAASRGDDLVTVSPDTSLLVAQGFTSRSGTDVATIVTAPDGATLRDAVACLFDPKVWPALRGRLVALDASNGTVTATEATSFRYARTGAFSLRNTRLVVAGWLSLNPIAFVGMALVLAIIMSGTTLMFVRGVGRRSE